MSYLAKFLIHFKSNLLLMKQSSIKNLILDFGVLFPPSVVDSGIVSFINVHPLDPALLCSSGVVVV